jgi:hypothetical protein
MRHCAKGNPPVPYIFGFAPGRLRPWRLPVCILLWALLLGGREILAEDFSAVFLPQPATTASSIQVTISAPLVGAATDSSTLSGTTTLVVSPSLADAEDAQLIDLELVLVDGMHFSLLNGAVTARAAPGAARVRMLESGPAGPIVQGQFDQLDNLFQFEGEIELSTEPEPYDLSTVAPMQADLLGIRIEQNANQGLIATLMVDLEFIAAISAPPLGQVPLTISLQATLQAVAPLQGSVDVDGNGHVDALDIDALHAAIRSQDSDSRFDLNGDGALDPADARLWVHGLMRTALGDADLNGHFDSSDLVFVLQRGRYEDQFALNSGWADGDWNGDGETDSSDLVLALQDGCYETNCSTPRAGTVAVPEPGGAALLATIGLVGLLARDRRVTARWGAREREVVDYGPTTGWFARANAFFCPW